MTRAPVSRPYRHRDRHRRRRRPRSRCRYSGKVRYYDRLAAMIALAGARNCRSSRRCERRYYRCPLCRGWHLTSQP